MTASKDIKTTTATTPKASIPNAVNSTLRPVRRKAIALLCALLFAMAIKAQITTLDWSVIPIDSLCPRYTEVVPLESDYRQNDYRVALLYPEWRAMTARESQQMEQWKDSVGEDLRINTFVGVMRGKGLLDVDFVPVVRRGGKYYKLLSAKMEITRTPKDQTRHAPSLTKRQGKASERYTKTSRLNEGRWVKISITEDGIYSLTASALRKMGFSNPANVHLYGHGGHLLSEVSNPATEYDDLEEVPLLQDGERWLFWGNGLTRWKGDERIINPYATAACYFLTEEEKPNGISTQQSPVGKPQTTYQTTRGHVLHEKDEFAYASFGRHLFERADYATGNAHSYKLTTPSSTKNEQLTIVFTAANDSKTEVQATVNSTGFDKFTVAAISKYIYGVSAAKTFDVSKLKSGKDWTVKLTSTSGQTAHLDYLAMHYDQSIDPTDGFVTFGQEKAGAARFRLSGNSAPKVMRISQPRLPAAMLTTAKDGEGQYVDVDDASCRYVAFTTDGTYPQPTVVGTIDNQNLHALDALDMVIIIPESGKLQAEAERLAEAHRQYDGLRVAVVRADHIYNEFSSGTPDATAYRRLMKMLYDRADGDESLMPRYLLLMGSCAFDNRMLTNEWRQHNPKDYLLCFESENAFSDTRSYVMEDYFGLLDDGEGSTLTRDKTDLGIGRFPVTTAEQAKVMVDKTIAYLSKSNAGAWKNIVMMLGDDGDNNDHMRYCDDVAQRIMDANPEMEVRKVMWDAYTRVSTLSTNTYPEVTSLIRKQNEEGAIMINYTGHGAANALSHEYVWYAKDFNNLTGTRLPLWFTAACDIMPFDAQGENHGENAVLNSKGGAMAFVGTTRTVYASNNWRLNHYFCEYVFGTDSQGRRYRLGDAMRLTKVALVGTESTNLENKLQYCLLGDPAITLGAPLNRVRLDAITDSRSGQKTDILKAGMTVKLEGHIVDADGQPMPRFQGIVTARVYDATDHIVCKRNDPQSGDAFEFDDRSSVIYAGQDSVADGRFSLTFVVPRDIKYSDKGGRIVFYAINDSLDIEANGYDESFTVGGTTDTDDTQGPTIELALNGEYGGTVNTTPYLTARLTDESGINTTGISVGHDIQLCIDGRADWTYTLNDYYVPDFGDYTNGSLGFTIPALTPGPHTLTLRAWDLLNNTGTASLDFTVDASYQPSILHLACSPNPVTTATTFLLSYDLPGSECHYDIEVFDFAGRRLWHHEGTGSTATGQFAIPWNLRVGAGYGRISPGIYLYRATLTSGNSKRVTKTQKMIVN